MVPPAYCTVEAGVYCTGAVLELYCTVGATDEVELYCTGGLPELGVYWTAAPPAAATALY